MIGKNIAWPGLISRQPAIQLAPVDVGTFQIDLGSAPYDGQVWNLNLDLDIPMEKMGSLHVASVRSFRGITALWDENAYVLDFSIS